MTQITTSAFRVGEKYRIAIVIEADQLQDIERLVKSRRTNRSAVVREAIDFYLKHRRDGDKAAA